MWIMQKGTWDKLVNITDVDNIFLKHEEKYKIYWNNCKESLFREYIKEHKGHELNQLNIDITKKKRYF